MTQNSPYDRRITLPDLEHSIPAFLCHVGIVLLYLLQRFDQISTQSRQWFSDHRLATIKFSSISFSLKYKQEIFLTSPHHEKVGSILVVIFGTSP